MKIRIIVVSIALFLSTSVVVSGQSIKSSIFRDGFAYSYVIDDETVKNTPSWNPEKEESPLPFRQAIEVARRNLNKFATEADENWEVSKVTLQRIGTNFPARKDEKWIYEIDFVCLLSKCESGSDSFTIYVKFDGKIVEPKVTLTEESTSLTDDVAPTPV